VSSANLHVVLDSHILEQLLVRVDLVLDAFLFLLRVQVLLHFLLPEGATHDCNTSGLSEIKETCKVSLEYCVPLRFLLKHALSIVQLLQFGIPLQKLM